MKCPLIILLIVLDQSLDTISETNVAAIKDENDAPMKELPFCSNGMGRAVAMCLVQQQQMVCQGNYQCERSTGLCCPASPSPLPMCHNGLRAVAMCINGNACNLGLKCTLVGSLHVCCRVCTNNGTSSGVCNATTECASPSSQCTLFEQSDGLCCPAVRCPNNAPSFGSCVKGSCSVTSTACFNGVCCPVCPTNNPTAGLCISEKQFCPTDYECLNGICCPATVVPETPCPLNAQTVSNCSATLACPNADTQRCTANVCCPKCPNNAQSPGLCQSSSCAAYPQAPICSQGICCPLQIPSAECPVGQVSSGKCLSGSQPCPPFYTCIKGTCCGSVTKNPDSEIIVN